LLIKLGDMLTYVITLTLVSTETFVVITLIVLSTDLENVEFPYIDIRINIITESVELYHCKSTTAGSCVCTQSHAVMS